MSDIVQQLFYLAIEKLPESSVKNVEKLENAFTESLAQDRVSQFQACKDALLEEQWEDMQNLFYMTPSLGIELDRLGVN